MSAQNVRYSTVKTASAHSKSGCLPRPVSMAGSSQRSGRMPTVGAGHGNWASTIGALKRLGVGFPVSPRRGVLTTQPHAWHAGLVRDVSHDAVRVHSDGSVERPNDGKKPVVMNCLENASEERDQILELIVKCFEKPSEVLDFVRHQFGDLEANSLYEASQFGRDRGTVYWYAQHVVRITRARQISHDVVMNSVHTYAVVNLLKKVFGGKQNTEYQDFIKSCAHLGVDLQQLPMGVNSLSDRANALVNQLAQKGRMKEEFFNHLAGFAPEKRELIKKISAAVSNRIKRTTEPAQMCAIESELIRSNLVLVLLADFLLTQYDSTDLYRMFQKNYPRIEEGVTPLRISYREYVLKMVDALHKNGKIDSVFFSLLKADLPQHAAALDYLASQIRSRK